MTTPVDVDKLCDWAAEAATLGSMIQNHRVIPSVLEFVTRESFYPEEHQTIFDTVLSVWRRNPGGALDGVLLRSELDQGAALKDIGGLDYLRQVVESTPTSANARFYAQRVAEKARYRQLVGAVGEMSRIVELGGEIDAQLQEVQRLAMSLDCEQTHKNVYDVRKCATQFATDTQEGTTAISTGFRCIDSKTSGLAPGDMWVIAARPSIGKTSMATGIAWNMARAGRRIVIFTLEMSARSLIERMCATRAEVSLQVIKGGHAPQETMNKFYQASLDLAKLSVRIVENSTTPEQQAAVIEAFQQIEPVDVALVDYLGLMSAGQRTGNRNDEVTIISKSLKHLAQRYAVPVIALSQLNRACEGRENHRPRLADLRDSGSLEQDADVVMFLHREDYYRKQRDPATKDLDGLAEVIIAKQRNGPTGIGRMVFIEEHTRFVDYSNEVE